MEMVLPGYSKSLTTETGSSIGLRRTSLGGCEGLLAGQTTSIFVLFELMVNLIFEQLSSMACITSSSASIESPIRATSSAATLGHVRAALHTSSVGSPPAQILGCTTPSTHFLGVVPLPCVESYGIEEGSRPGPR